MENCRPTLSTVVVHRRTRFRVTYTSIRCSGRRANFYRRLIDLKKTNVFQLWRSRRSNDAIV